MRLASFVWALSLLVPAIGVGAGELKLAKPFSDHMVLQREKSVPVWGWADPGEQVTVQFAGQSKSAPAGADGKWTVYLDSMQANAEPRSLKASCQEPPQSVEVTDVLVGEVWLGSGQSNMAMTVARCRDFASEQASADLPLIRMFTESSTASDSAKTDASGTWAVCSPQTVGSFSGTLYFFGRELHRELGIPVGLINSSVGGTPIESWIAGEAQASNEALQSAYEQAARAYAAFDEEQAQAEYAGALARWKQLSAQAKAEGTPVPAKPINPVERIRRRGGPGGLFHGKIAPLVPYALRGVVWYQGEGNARIESGHLYRHQLALLVSDWRERWGEELPFAWVQLPNYGRGSDGWMLVREGMLETLQLPRTGMAITIDIGESDDIHPRNKQDVGSRLAMWALGDVYGMANVATSGPLPAGHEVRDGQFVVTFSHCNGGLQSKGGKPLSFEIAGEDRLWKSATATIEGDQVLVSHPEVEHPVAVRYAWRPDPVCNLYNGQGLPASPFRTDDWNVE